MDLILKSLNMIKIPKKGCTDKSKWNSGHKYIYI